jgi:hypothetical protein
MNLASITTNGLSEEGVLQVLFMFSPVIDGESGVRKVRTWKEIEDVCKSNEIDFKTLLFNPDVLVELERAWGKAL